MTTHKPNLTLDVNEVRQEEIEGVVVMLDVAVIDALWGSFQDFMKWEDEWRKETGRYDVYMEGGRLQQEWLKNIGLEGKVYFYGAEKEEFSTYCAAMEAKRKGFKYCIAENLS